MGANLGTGGNDRRNLNVEINLVPFIDLMSCLTAFLLVTSVWINIAELDTRPRGRAPGSPVTEPPPPQLSVLIQSDGFWLGQSPNGELQHIDGHDWTALTAALTEAKAGPVFVDRSDIQIAAESTAGKVVPYQDLIQAMDVAHMVGFVDVGLSDPAGLETRPVL